MTTGISITDIVNINTDVAIINECSEDDPIGKQVTLKVKKGWVRGFIMSETIKNCCPLFPYMGRAVSHVIVDVPAIGCGTWEKYYKGDPNKDWDYWANLGNINCKIPHMTVSIPINLVNKD